ncbi:MAG: hypothetical protein K2M56_00010 [Muribaculaceae bacterium]|nr:hypothetical protein [Muribaculaceae bacterium]
MKKFLLSLATVAIATGASAESVTVSFPDLGYSNSEKVTTVATNDPNIAIECAKADNTNGTAPAYYDTGTGVRLYTGNTMTITGADGCEITKIEFKAQSLSYVLKGSVNTGKLEVPTYLSPADRSMFTVWTGSASEVVVTASATCRIQTIEVTYESDGQGGNEEPDPVFPEGIALTTDGDHVNVVQEYDETSNQLLVSLTGETAKDTLEVTFEVPEGWTGYVGANFEDLGMGTSIFRSSKDDDDENWVPMDVFMQAMGGLKETNTLTFQLTSAGAPFMGGMYLYYGEKVYVAGSIVIQGDVKSGTVGVEAVEAVDADATYFNLQGVEVKTPGAGVYVKVANGKASKVVIR